MHVYAPPVGQTVKGGRRNWRNTLPVCRSMERAVTPLAGWLTGWLTGWLAGCTLRWVLGSEKGLAKGAPGHFHGLTFQE